MTETVAFKMHPELLYSVITAQAGTPGKAILEAVMNSIDAGASRVEVTADAKGFSIKDDGKGFKDREEIENFFAVFGTPHKEGDATYGKFRMGRGQLFAFGSNQWRSGNFAMDVDIKVRGLDFGLKELSEVHPGCAITGVWYDALLPSELDALVREVKDLVAWAQIPVIFNNVQINKLPSKEKWDYETDDAYIKLKESGQLMVYNLGVLVRGYPASTFGTGGIIVSKRQLQVNFARNDVLVAKCETWKGIKAKLKDLVVSRAGKQSTRITEDERIAQAKMLLTGEIDFKTGFEQLKLLTDISGKHLSLSLLTRRLYANESVTVAPQHGSRVGNAMHDRKLAVVLSPLTLERFNVTSLQQLQTELEQAIDLGEYSHTWYKHHYLQALQRITANEKDFATLAQELSSGHELIDEKKLGKDDMRLLMAVRSIADRLGYGLREYGVAQQTRKIMVGKSETAEAWTDGAAYIAIKLEQLQMLRKAGFGGAHKLVLLLVHEYLHDKSDSGSHSHDQEFYESFHNIAMDPYIAKLTYALMAEYARLLRRAGVNVVRTIVQSEDLTVRTGTDPEDESMQLVA